MHIILFVQHLAEFVHKYDKRVLEGAQQEAKERQERERETARLRKQNELMRNKHRQEV